ncbi:MAG: hypothetical protein FWD34_01550 [Oscillospiraceae bacterium]|nr:hypothetical protein [Oscillospiraceae bacterium]
MAEKQKQPQPSQQGGVFKTVPMGFDKREVNLYIKNLIKEKEDELQTYITNNKLSGSGSAPSGGDGESAKIIESLNKELEAERKKSAKLQSDLTNLEKANAAGGKAPVQTVVSSGDPEAFKAVLEQLRDGKTKADNNYFALAAFFSEAITSLEDGLASFKASAATAKSTITIDKPAEQKASKPAAPAVSSEFDEFADFAIDAPEPTPAPAPAAASEPAVSDLDDFADFTIDSSDLGVSGSADTTSDELSEFADFAFDGDDSDDSDMSNDLSDFSDFSLDEPDPAPKQEPQPEPVQMVQPVKEPEIEIEDIQLEVSDASDDTPLLKKGNKGEFSEDFQDFMLNSNDETGIKGSNLSENDVVVKHEKGGDLDESLFEMMLSPTTGALSVSENGEGGFTLSGSENVPANDYVAEKPPTPAEDNHDNFDDFMAATDKGTRADDSGVIKITPESLDAVWNFDMDEDNDEDDDMSSDHIEISDLLL